MKRIHVGSMNQTKLIAAEHILLQSKLYTDARVVGVDVVIEEFGHPKTIADTIQGAKDRALAAYEGSLLGVGLESGLIEAPGTTSGYLELAICALYDGSRFAIGSSPAFEWPTEVQKLILQGLDGSQAFKQAGLTDHHKLGAADGAIHTLTHGNLNRTKQNELALTMALIQLENPAIYT